MKRVVTGHDHQGRSVVLMEGEPPRVSMARSLPGWQRYEIWATEDNPQVPIKGDDPTVMMKNFIPSPGGTGFCIEYFPPDARIHEGAGKANVDRDKAGADFAEVMPDIAAKMESDDSGMHTTDTIDYNIILAGELWCELDDGVEVHLRAGDCLVQCGTRHAWHNKSAETCTKAAIVIGVARR